MSVELISPEGWPRGKGYAHGAAASGRLVFTAGQIGWDPRTEMLVSPDFGRQAAQALANVAEVLKAAGASGEHLTRMTWYITDRSAYVAARIAIGEAYREHIGTHFPPMAVVVVAALLDAGALVEIEATAVIPS